MGASETGQAMGERGRHRIMRGCTWLLAVPLAILAEMVAVIRLREKRERRRREGVDSRVPDSRQEEPEHERS